jgi:large subunit ribosomal protein L10
MAKTKAQKQVILDRLTQALTKASTAVFVHFKGVSVAEESAMRKSLKQDGISYFVAKKTLIGKALTANGFASPELEGEVAVAYLTQGADTTAPARLTHEFSTKFGAERFSLLGGIFESTLQDKAAITEIATIPSAQVLRGMFVNVINSPIQGLVIALDGIAQKKS